jgi:hypothetical protein
MNSGRYCLGIEGLGGREGLESHLGSFIFCDDTPRPERVDRPIRCRRVAFSVHERDRELLEVLYLDRRDGLAPSRTCEKLEQFDCLCLK